MLDKIKEMRGFLTACRVTDYLLPDQIALLTVALDVMEAHLRTGNAAEVQAIANAVEARTHAGIVYREGC